MESQSLENINMNIEDKKEEIKQIIANTFGRVFHVQQVLLTDLPKNKLDVKIIVKLPSGSIGASFETWLGHGYEYTKGKVSLELTNFLNSILYDKN